MNPPPIHIKPRLRWPNLLFAFLSVLTAVAFGADGSAKRPFNIPAGAAESALRQFAEQATGVQFFFSADKVSGARTAAIRGDFTVEEALERMLAGSGLVAVQDEKTGALTVLRASPDSPSSGRRGPEPEARPQDDADGVVKMTPFEVSGDRNYGYLKTNSVTTSRIGVPIIKEPASIAIISSELLKDFAVTEYNKVFRYSSGVVAGETEVGQAGIFTMRGFNMARFFNGVSVASSFSITPLLVTDNIDRIEIAKGAIGLFYGNVLPNGVANYITKKPQFTKAASLGLTYGSNNLSRASVDVQDTINRSTAYRLITSYESRNGRYEDEKRDYTFVAPSVTFRPNDKFEVSAEFNYTKSHASYPVFDWHLVVNPAYFRDVTNPSQQIVDYMRNAYGLADDAAARALINQRWNSGPFRSYLVNWSEDIYGMTGRQPYPADGSTIDWWRLSPKGDRWTSATKESSTNGSSSLTDVAVTMNPVENLSIRYRWLHNDVKQTFMRALSAPPGGLRPDGRWRYLNFALALDLNPDNLRQGTSDTQQVDAVFETEAFGMRHKFIGGAEWTRTTAQWGAVNVDYSNLAPVTDGFGNVLTGSDIFTKHDPFAGNPEPNFNQIMDGAPFTGQSIGRSEATYLSYRGSAMNDRLNLLAGARRTVQPSTGNSQISPTYGAIFEVVPGFHVFASQSETVIFVNRMSAIGLALTPADNPHPLQNEKDKGMEFGFKTNWREDTLSGTVAYYKAERDGILKTDLTRMLADPRNQDNTPINDVQFYVNGGIDRVQGIEGDLTWTPSRRFQGMFNWNYMWEAETISDPSINKSLPGRLTYIKKFDERLQKTPEWQVNLVAKYNFVSGSLEGFSLGGAARYASAYHASDYELYNLIVPAETLIDVFASYQTRIFNTPTLLRLSVTNITNKINDITRGQGTEGSFSIDFNF